MWVCLECATRGLITDWIPQAGFCSSYGIGRMFWHLQCCGVSLALARTQWYWFDWNVLQAIIITRLYAMYEGSRKILIFLIVIFLAVNIFDAVIAVMTTMHSSAGMLDCRWNKCARAHLWLPEEDILFGTYQCLIYYLEDMLLLKSLVWIVSTAWEVLTLCLAVWIAVKHFRELRRHPSGEDCFTMLMKTHMLYFARWAHIVMIVPFFHWRVGPRSFVAVSCFQLIINFSPSMSAMVCQPFIHLCMQPRFIFSIGTIFPRSSDL
jgi:hypothetical protein